MKEAAASSKQGEAVQEAAVAAKKKAAAAKEEEAAAKEEEAAVGKGDGDWWVREKADGMRQLAVGGRWAVFGGGHRTSGWGRWAGWGGGKAGGGGEEGCERRQPVGERRLSIIAAIHCVASSLRSVTLS